MNTILRKTLPILALVALLAASGCATIQAWLTPARVEAVAKLAFYGAGKALCLKGDCDKVKLARDGLATLENTEVWDITTAIQIAQQNGLDQLNTPEAQLVISGGVMLVDLIVGKTIDLKDQPQVKAFIVGAREGLDLALGPAALARAKAATLSDRDPVYEQLLREAKATRPKH